jgi:hypothetical protein
MEMESDFKILKLKSKLFVFFIFHLHPTFFTKMKSSDFSVCCFDFSCFHVSIRLG